MRANYTYILFTVLLSFAACREKDIVDVGGTGVLKGYVLCYDKLGSVNNEAAVKITVEGTDPLRTLQTDVMGNFQADNLPMGTYNLVFERAGYGTYRAQGFSFVGGDEPVDLSIGLYKLPELEITDFELEAINSLGNVRLTGSFYIDTPGAGDQAAYMRYYLSDTPDVSPTHYRQTTSDIYYASNGYAEVLLSLNTTLFPAGTTLYVVAYPCTETSQNYTDLATGLKTFTSVAAKGSSVIQILVP